MNKSNIKYIISLFLILISIIFTLFFVDYKFNFRLFGSLSVLFSIYIYDIFGNFSYMFASTGFFIGGSLLLRIKKENKILFIIGYSLFIAFLPIFFETYNILNFNCGFYGINSSKIFQGIDNFKKVPLFFFWFFTSVLLMIYPFKNFIAFKLFSIIKKESQKNKQAYYEKPALNYNIPFKSKPQKNKNFAWLSKVIYEDNSRVEIPVMPVNDSTKIKKFILVNESPNIEEYHEIETKSSEDNSKDKEKYFKSLKSDWPDKWKKNDLTENNYEIIEENDNKLLPILKDEDKKSNIIKKEKISEIKITNFLENEKVKPKANIISEKLPETDILENEVKYNYSQFKTEHIESAKILEETLQEFGIKAEVSEIIHGPVVTLFKIVPAAGIKLQKIESLSNNLALRLAAKSIRIIAPIPGEKVVGIEIPNSKRIIVKFKEIVNNDIFTESKYNIPVGLGKDIYGNIITIDLFKMPHVLIAGATGAGKSVCVNAIISSILFAKNPNEVKFILIDPKIVELKPYNNIPHLLTPVITDPKEAINALKYLIIEMERRYSLLDERGARDIVEYKNKTSKESTFEDLPFIITIVDEFADLMSTSGKEAEILFARIAAKARAVGIHLILATQRPSIDVITGLIKANIPARIAFQVISIQDSRIILDQKGAEKLLGQGDMLYLSPTHPYPIRLQGAYLSKNEVDLICDHWKSIAAPNYINIADYLELMNEIENEESMENSLEDPLFQEAVDIIYQTQKASASYLQRRLSIGYNRAARMIEEMEKMGIVGPQKGAKAREIISAKPSF